MLCYGLTTSGGLLANTAREGYDDVSMSSISSTSTASKIIIEGLEPSLALEDMLDPQLMSVFKSITSGHTSYERLFKIIKTIYENEDFKPISLIEFTKYVFLNAFDRREILFLLRLCGRIKVFDAFRPESKPLFHKNALFPFMVKYVNDSSLIIACLRILRYNSIPDFCLDRRVSFEEDESRRFIFLHSQLCPQSKNKSEIVE